MHLHAVLKAKVLIFSVVLTWRMLHVARAFSLVSRNVCKNKRHGRWHQRSFARVSAVDDISFGLEAKRIPDDLLGTSSLWKGNTHFSSEFVVHYRSRGEKFTIAQAIQSAISQKDNLSHLSFMENQPLLQMFGPLNHTETEYFESLILLKLGSVWFLSHADPRQPSLGAKPRRLSLEDQSTVLEQDDYMRIHFDPRRFPTIYHYDWRIPSNDNDESDTTSSSSSINNVVVAHNVDKGYVVIDKPARVPVHATVDNALENVAACLKQTHKAYLSNPQRLDQNTSGLLVMAVSKPFSSYFAQLLRNKTRFQLSSDGGREDISRIEKRYKCLVCFNRRNDSTNNWSVQSELQRIKGYLEKVMRHYLEPSIRAPKHFASVAGNETWLESLLQLKAVGPVYPLVGSDAGKVLARQLWSNTESMPSNCVGVVELELELLTGRTHQIRGQLSAEGFPLVGDVQYGGATASDGGSSRDYFSNEQLALQCHELKFLDPDVLKNEDETIMVPSKRWNSFTLNEAWWTRHLAEYNENSSGEPVTTSDTDEESIQALVDLAEDVETPPSNRMLRLPPQVQLSPGTNKYVLIKARKQKDTLWFVRSSSPCECGGAYHANVAQELVRVLTDAGFRTTVTGGGRIDFDRQKSHAHVYGFSYGFGKGDHAFAAHLIEHETNMTASYDDADGLY